MRDMTGVEKLVATIVLNNFLKELEDVVDSPEFRSNQHYNQLTSNGLVQLARQVACSANIYHF